MTRRRAFLVSGLVFLIGVAVLGGALVAARVTAASLGFALALIIPAGALALLAGALGLVLGVVAYIVERGPKTGDERVEKEDVP